jgi:hypothetical protein
MILSGRIVLVAWGSTLCLVSLFGVLVFGLDVLPAGLLAGAGAACILTGLAVPQAAGSDQRQNAISIAGATIALGAGLMLAGFVAAGSVIGVAGAVICGMSVAALAREGDSDGGTR